MFYSRQQIKQLLICTICGHEFSDPRIVPCGKTFCNECVNQSANKNLLIRCVCKGKHQIPESGFPINEIVALILIQKPREIYRGEKAEALKSKLAEIKNLTNEVQHDLEDGENRIKEYCKSIENDIDLTIETAIQTIQDKREQFLEKTKAYEQECVENLKSIVDRFPKESFISEINKMNQFHQQWNEYLEGFEITNDKISQAIENSEINIKELERARLALYSHLFKNKQLKFRQEFNFPESAIGTLEFENFIEYIDLKKLKTKKIDINIKMNDLNQPLFDLDRVNSDSLALCFCDINGDTYVRVQRKQYFSKKKLSNHLDNLEIKLTSLRCCAVNERIFCEKIYSNNSSYFYIISNLTSSCEIQEERIFQKRFDDFHANSKYLYFLVDGSNLTVFDFKLRFYEKYDMPNGNFTNIRVNDEYCFLIKEDGTVVCYGCENMEFVASFKVKNNQVSLGSDNLLVSYDSSNRHLCFRELFDPIECVLKIDVEINPTLIKWNANKAIIFDKSSMTVYY